MNSNNNNGLNLSNLVYKDRNGNQNQKQSFTIRESNLEREDIFKLGKSLFILLNDNSIKNQSSVRGKVKEIASKSNIDNGNSNDNGIGNNSEDILFSNSSDFKKALNSIDKSIEINPVDSMNSIIDSMVSRFNEIQINSGKNIWKLDLSSVISNLYCGIENQLKQHQKPAINSNIKDKSIVIKRLSNPPQDYFEIFRLFTYILNNYSSIFYKSIYYKITDNIIEINKDCNNNNDNSNDNNSIINNNSTNNSNKSEKEDNNNNNSSNNKDNDSNNSISEKRKFKDELNKDEKRQILDLFNFIQQFYLIYSFNNMVKIKTLDDQELSLIINQIIPAINNSILNKCSITNLETGIVSPTRLTTQSSDILISLVIVVIINLQIINNSNNEEDNNNTLNQIDCLRKLLESLNNNLIDYFNEVKKWYHNKPLFISSIDLITEILSNEFSNTINNLIFIYQIIPLFYYQYPINIKIFLLNNNIQSLLKISSQTQSDLLQIQTHTILIIQLLSNLSEKSFNNYIKDNKKSLTNILLFLINIKNSDILKRCSSKLLEIIYNINLNSNSGLNDGYCMELIKNEDLMEKPAIIDFIIVLIKNSPQLIKSLIDILNYKENNNIVIINNIIIIIESLYKQVPDLLPKSVKEDILNILLPIPPRTSSSTYSSSSLSVLLNGFEPSIILPRFLQYIFINNENKISNEFIDSLNNWLLNSIQDISSSTKEPSLEYKFEIFLEIILDNYSKLPSNSNKSYCDPTDLYNNEDDYQDQVNGSNENIQKNYNYEVLVDKIIPSLGERLSQVKENELRYNYWKVIINILEIKCFSNPKNSTISKILPKLIKFIDKQFIISIIISNVNSKLKSQNSILNGTSSTTTITTTNGSSEEVFKFLSPLLMLTVSIKEVFSELYQFSKQSAENDILIAELVDNLIKRINSTNLLLEIRRLASDCCSYTPPSYWSNSMSNALTKQYQNYSNIQDNSNESLIKSSLQFIKLILFCFCNGYLVHGSIDINEEDNNGIPFKNSKELLNLFDLILFKYSDASKELINASPDSEIGKLFMAVGDCISFMVKSNIKNESLAIASKSTISLNTEKLKNQQSLILFNKINSMNDLIPTLFRIILFTNSIQKQSRPATTLINSETNIDYYYSKRSKIVLLNSFITLIKLLDSNENEYLAKQITLLLIKINYIENSNIIDIRIKIGSIQILFNLYFKLEEESESLKLYSENLLDLIKYILDGDNSNNNNTAPISQLKLASLRLLGVLMKFPRSIFTNQSNIKEITYMLTLLSTDNDKEIKSLSLNLLNLLKTK